MVKGEQMRVNFAVGIVLAIWLAFGPPLVSAQTVNTSPASRKAVALSSTSFSIPNNPASAPTFTVTIQKAQKKSLILLQVSLVAHANADATFVLVGRANGIDMEPMGAIPHHCATPTGDCTISANWWLDVEAADAAHPGLFVNQPVSISVLAAIDPPTSAPGADGIGNISITAQAVKR
jgi:hypothetical protein